MKINEILVEAEIDALITQTAPSVKSPAVAQGRAVPGWAKTAVKGINAITKTVAGAPQGIPSSGYAKLPKDSNADDETPAPATASTNQPLVAPKNAEYFRTLAKNKVATTGTNSPEVNAVLTSAGMLKQQ